MKWNAWKLEKNVRKFKGTCGKWNETCKKLSGTWWKLNETCENGLHRKFIKMIGKWNKTYQTWNGMSKKKRTERVENESKSVENETMCKKLTESTEN